MQNYSPILANQKGVVLLIALIVLVAMTLAAIALVRSVDTSNIIAGNLAFQQSATNSGDMGSETAITWLQTKNNGTILRVSDAAHGYSATWDPTIGYSWTDLAAGLTAQSLGADAAGNTVRYVIHRLCTVENVAMDPNSPAAGCAAPAVIAAGNCSQTANQKCPDPLKQRYYRITSQITGPRNTISYTQTIVAM
ncbi:MAG: hypothetical protein ACAH07_06555 [Methylophilaceae bacterium]|nr:hypothetical protein [Methyloradius sp.]